MSLKEQEEGAVSVWKHVMQANLRLIAKIETIGGKAEFRGDEIIFQIPDGKAG